MKYLVLAVWHDHVSNQVATHSKEVHVLNEPEDEAEQIITDICSTGMDRSVLWEVFVFKSAQNYGSAPEQVAYWNQEDGLFGEQEDEEDEQEDEEEGSDQS